MVVTIHSSSSPEEIAEALKKINETGKKSLNKSFDAFKYCGVIKLKEDPTAIQKRMRNEWEQ